MSSKDGDSLRIPIEIKTEDLKELRNLIQEITEAQSAVRELQPKRGKTKDSSSRSAFSSSTDDGFGIFSGAKGGEALPSKGRDKTSRQAFQRESEFNKIRERMTDLEKTSIDANSTLINVAALSGIYIPSLGKGKALVMGGAAQLKNMFSKSQNFAGGFITPNTTGSSQLTGFARLRNSLFNAAKFIPVIGAVIAFADVLVNELPQIIRQELYGPGKIFDTRFRREIRKEIMLFQDRQEKAMKRQGFREVRITTSPNLRGMYRRFQVGGNFFDLTNGGQSRIGVFMTSSNNFDAGTAQLSYKNKGLTAARDRRTSK